MGVSEFLSQLQIVEDAVKNATKGLFAKFDSFTFKMLIGWLKSNDPEAVMVSIDQLANEKRQISIPPLYVVSRAHPIDRVRARALAALEKMDEDNEIEKLTAGKEVKDAVAALVERFGNFKQM
jgi:hypothetical protein